MMGIRTAVMASLESPKWAATLRRSPVKRMGDLGYILRWGAEHGMAGRSKRRVRVNIPSLVEKWIEAVIGMCTAHDKDTYDAHDAMADELLSPLMSAPIKQVRQFYHDLLAAMKADKRVPLIVWMAFDSWGAVVVKDAPDEGVKRLKKKLAADIADLVEEPIRDQIPQAIIRALMWRDEETLKSVKGVLESGVKPKLVGRESCLFLEAGRGAKKVSVML